MRTARNLQQKMYYALQGTEETPIYNKDENGNIIYYTTKEGNQLPMIEGSAINYESPVEMLASLSFSSGEAEAKEYGIDTSGYDSVMITPLNAYPLSETSVIWAGSDIIYKDDEKTVPDEKSADFRIVAVKPSLNVSKYLLKRITK